MTTDDVTTDDVTTDDVTTDDVTTDDVTTDDLPTDPAELQALVNQMGWFHSIDLGNGVRTPGFSDPALTPEELAPFEGRSVLDIGAWDGYYSFLAERLGARRVVALDHYAWGVDIPARDAYWRECEAAGRLPDHGRDTTDFWHPELPGRRGFELARRVLGSSVEAVTADFMTADLDELGTFDVVVYLGVLYHVKEPLTALERVRKVTTGVAVVETEALRVSGNEDSSLLFFEAANGLGADFGNWYVPSIRSLHQLCLAAGFARVETVKGPPVPPAPVVAARPLWKRAAGWALRELSDEPPRPPAPAPTVHYRAVVRAYV